MGVKSTYNWGQTNADLADMSKKQWNDFINSGALFPWNINPIASGTNTFATGNAKHPGVMSYSSHASNANSGCGLIGNSSAILLGGGEKTTIVFKTPSSLTGVTRRIGFHDTADQNAPNDGVYVLMNGVTLNGRTMNNGTGSNTASTYTIAVDTWYRLVIQLNADATLATFTLYTDDSTTVLWTDTLATNIPKTSGRETSHRDVCTLASPSGATVIGYLDYMDIVLPNARRV
jgi:hypothetical protein